MADSRALPVGFYRDPADVLESLEMRQLGCQACSKHVRVLGKVVCTEPRNERQAGVPGIGDRCKWFELKG